MRKYTQRRQHIARKSEICGKNEKKLSLESYLKHKLNILGSNENNFLNNIRQSSWS